MLQDSEIHFEVLQEYSSGARGETIILGNIKLNLAEFVEMRDDGEEGVARRYLMQASKINSTLKVRKCAISVIRPNSDDVTDQHRHETHRRRSKLHRVRSASSVLDLKLTHPGPPSRPPLSSAASLAS